MVPLLHPATLVAGPRAPRRPESPVHAGSTARTGSPAPAGIGWPALTAVGVVTTIVVIAARLVVPGGLDRISVGIGVIGILLGIPHGAVDHLVPFWASGRRPSVIPLVRVLGAYLVVTAVAITALVLTPTLAVAGFLAASAFHFGRAEAEFVAERRGRAGGLPAESPSASAPSRDRLRAAAHGLTVVVLPLALWHRRVSAVLDQLAPGLTGRAALVAFSALAVVTVALDLVLIATDLRRHRRAEAAEMVLVLLLMVIVPPLPAFAVYFSAWHAVRHTARLLALPGPGGCALSRRAALRRYLGHAIPPTLVVIVALAVIVSTGSRSLVASGLVVLVALTFPHMRTVAALDRTVRSA